MSTMKNSLFLSLEKRKKNAGEKERERLTQKGNILLDYYKKIEWWF